MLLKYFFFLLIEVLDQRSSEITGLDNSHTCKYIISNIGPHKLIMLETEVFYKIKSINTI